MLAKKRSKKKLIAIAGLVCLGGPLAFVGSCNQNNTTNWFANFNGFKTLIANYEYQDEILKARVTKWKDGDTFDFEQYDPKSKQWWAWDGGRKLILRISFIDTPEYHVPGAPDGAGRGDLTDKEITWAKKAADWAKQEIPQGTEVRIWKTGLDSYGRAVGSVFYNKGSEKGFNDNFSVNIIRAGYTLPRVRSKSQIVSSKGAEEEILNFLSVPLYHAWQEAKSRKVNLYGLSSKEQASVYTKHGEPSNKLAVVKKLEQRWFDEWTFKKYKIYK